MRLTYPPDFTFPSGKLVKAYQAAGVIAELAPGRRMVVQAGGCAGLWPLALAGYFERVVTCEPNPVNFQYLQHNVSVMPNITAFQCALGEAHECVGLERPKAKAGLWRVNGTGNIPMMPIDDLVGDAVVDAIVLDVEGSELRALRGAERVIAEYRPLLWCEFIHNAPALEAFMADHGYGSPVQGLGGDRYSVHTSRLVH